MEQLGTPVQPELTGDKEWRHACRIYGPPALIQTVVGKAATKVLGLQGYVGAFRDEAVET